MESLFKGVSSAFKVGQTNDAVPADGDGSPEGEAPREPDWKKQFNKGISFLKGAAKKVGETTLDTASTDPDDEEEEQRLLFFNSVITPSTKSSRKKVELEPLPWEQVNEVYPWFSSTVTPYCQSHIEGELRSRILSISEFEETLKLRAPPHYVFDLKSKVKLAKRLLKEDARLAALRFKLVPKKLNEELFWTNYFYHVEENISQLADDIRSHRLPHSVPVDGEDEFLAGEPGAGAATGATGDPGSAPFPADLLLGQVGPENGQPKDDGEKAADGAATAPSTLTDEQLFQQLRAAIDSDISAEGLNGDDDKPLSS
eukprot:GHVU01090888.1.p1 GENE.GHVU01090888.1~~GHVU01090888.1.p1  ORF type:complete len:314 (+),score=67.08 GHVU01090888.1:183-1124(+)